MSVSPARPSAAELARRATEDTAAAVTDLDSALGYIARVVARSVNVPLAASTAPVRRPACS